MEMGVPAPEDQSVVVDDHRLMRAGLVSLLGRGTDDLEVVGEAAAGEQASSVAADRPDVVLMECRCR